MSRDDTTRRLALLEQIGRGAVLRLPSGETREYDPDGRYATVNGPVGEMEQAGWAQLGGVVTDGPYRHPTQRARAWQLTRAGEEEVARVAAELTCGRCAQRFDAADKTWNGRARYRDWQFCRSCVDRCHESTDFAHTCVICNAGGIATHA